MRVKGGAWLPERRLNLNELAFYEWRWANATPAAHEWVRVEPGAWANGTAPLGYFLLVLAALGLAGGVLAPAAVARVRARGGGGELGAPLASSTDGGGLPSSEHTHPRAHPRTLSIGLLRWLQASWRRASARSPRAGRRRASVSARSTHSAGRACARPLTFCCASS
jgi:hypothetical protein